MYFHGGKWFISDKELRVLADYVITNKVTLRSLEGLVGISKSTLHTIFHTRLPNIDYVRYLKLQFVLDNNYKDKHIRGGNATKEKYAKFKENTENKGET